MLFFFSATKRSRRLVSGLFFNTGRERDRERERAKGKKMYKILKSHLGENRKEIKVKVEKQKRTKEKHDFVNTVSMNKTQKGA